MSQEIVEFLLARIAEEEYKARIEARLRDGDPYYDDEASTFDRYLDPGPCPR